MLVQAGIIKRSPQRAAVTAVSLYLLHQEAFLHVLWLYSPEQLHRFIETLAAVQFLLGSQSAFQENQAHSKEDLDS